MADRKNTLPGTGPAPSAPKSIRQRAWTMLGGKTLEEASAADLTKAGIGIRPPRKATQEANALHAKELRQQLRRQRFVRALPFVVMLGMGAVIAYLIGTRS